MNALGKINTKMLMVLVVLVAISIFYGYEQKSVNNTLRAFLEWNKLGLTLWLFTLVSFSVHYLSNRNSLSGYTGVIFSHFGAFADSAFAAITFGLASTTSASILKGIYIQQHFGDTVYFSNFNEIDIYSMLVVCVFLFGYSLFSCLKVLSYSLYLSSAEEASPVYE